ncbi:hypothetical protein E5170_11600 [Pseudomonas atacamensis]|uniref:Uncharacterized protein n=1 Tax=Pseudomonas atacamensis TaxID=2565368 RepID=A0AAQ2DCX1_9PSED|nr:hypothetical protein E5170_11600 [Pseudomonas atacamensis]
MRGSRGWRRFCGSRRRKLEESSACRGAFSSRLAPTFACILTGEMQSTMGASLLAKRPLASFENQASGQNARIPATP